MLLKRIHIILFLSITYPILGQNLLKIHPTSIDFYSENYINQISNACCLYIKETNDGVGQNLLNVDFKVNRDTITIVVNKEIELLSLLEKYPDGIINLQTENALVLMHSINYSNNKDTLWMHQVYQKVIHFFPNSRIKIVSWKNNMFKIEKKAAYSGNIEIYDPPIYEYVYVNNELISKKETNNYLFLHFNSTKDVDRPWSWR